MTDDLDLYERCYVGAFDSYRHGFNCTIDGQAHGDEELFAHIENAVSGQLLENESRKVTMKDIDIAPSGKD